MRATNNNNNHHYYDDDDYFDILFLQDVLHRHPLYLIMRMLCYDDGLGTGKNLLALKTTDPEQEGCSIWVYQCSSSVSASE